jgi:hypothetical protein
MITANTMMIPNEENSFVRNDMFRTRSCIVTSGFPGIARPC